MKDGVLRCIALAPNLPMVERTCSSPVARARFASEAGTTGASGKTGDTPLPKRMIWKRLPAGIDRTASCGKMEVEVHTVSPAGRAGGAQSTEQHLNPNTPAALHAPP